MTAFDALEGRTYTFGGTDLHVRCRRYAPDTLKVSIALQSTVDAIWDSFWNFGGEAQQPAASSSSDEDETAWQEEAPGQPTCEPGEAPPRDPSTPADVLGLDVWPAALALSSYLSQHARALVQGSTVVELGAGVGLPSLLAACLGAKRVVLTDYEPRVLDLARLNAGLNGVACGRELGRVQPELGRVLAADGRPGEEGEQSSDACCSDPDACILYTARLDWTRAQRSVESWGWLGEEGGSIDDSSHATTSSPEGPPPAPWKCDLVLGADVLYETNLTGPFLHALRCLLAPNGLALVAHQTRKALGVDADGIARMVDSHDAPLRAFLKKVRRAGLALRELGRHDKGGSAGPLHLFAIALDEGIVRELEAWQG